MQTRNKKFDYKKETNISNEVTWRKRRRKLEKKNRKIRNGKWNIILKSSFNNTCTHFFPIYFIKSEKSALLKHRDRETCIRDKRIQQLSAKVLCTFKYIFKFWRTQNSTAVKRKRTKFMIFRMNFIRYACVSVAWIQYTVIYL